MIDSETTPQAQLQINGPDDVWHIVGRWQGLLDDLHIAVPRALCGESMEEPPGYREPPASAPTCPMCADRERGR